MKRDGRSVSNFNISVAVTDEFMRALKEDGEYAIRDPYKGRKAGTKKARDGLPAPRRDRPGPSATRASSSSTASTGAIRPGVWAPSGPRTPAANSLSTPTNRATSAPSTSRTSTTPPSPDCFDRDRFAGVVATAVRFLDDVIEVNTYPLPQIAEMTRSNRRIGLGVMGWADLLLKLGLRYDSPEALAFAGDLIGFMRERADAESRELGRLKGSFPNVDKSVFKGTDRRNATVLTIAPTGTIARIAGCSSSVEPVFAFEFTSKITGRRAQGRPPAL